MNTNDKETKEIPVFSETEIAPLCDAIRNNNAILMAVGRFFQELGPNQPDSNVLLTDFRKWGIRTIASQVLEKQFSLINQMAEIYEKEQRRLSDECVKP